MTRLPILFALLMLTHAQAADAPPGELRQGDCQRPKPGQDLRHCSFAGRNLQASTSVPAGLTAWISATTEPGCRLQNASLSGVDPKWATLADCDLSHANLDAAGLSVCGTLYCAPLSHTMEIPR